MKVRTLSRDAMAPWVEALVWSILMGVISGYNLRTDSRLSNESFMSGRASVSAGPCQASPANITIPAGRYADFTSPNYPSNYGAFQQCSWNFQTDTSAQLWLSCDPVILSWLASLYIIVQGTRYTKTCAPGGQPDTFQFMIRSNTATVGLHNYFMYTNKGFSCRILSVLKPSNDGCNCGVIQSQRIVGGQETAPHQFPWMVLIFSTESSDDFCDGSLITDEFVLTAAHCTHYLSTSDIQVRLGIHNRFTPPADSLQLDVLQIIEHPLYDMYHDYDASLLRISAVDFTAHPKIRPICLPTGSNTYAGQQAITAGWGHTTVMGDNSPVLMAVTVPVISNSACKTQYGKEATDVMICAGSAGLNSCQGDSGGPLFLSEGSGYQVIIGVVISITLCGYGGYPGLNTRTTALKSWIVSKLDGSTVCSPP